MEDGHSSRARKKGGLHTVVQFLFDFVERLGRRAMQLRVDLGEDVGDLT